MSYYVHEDEILGESRFRRKPFVKSGNAFLPMQRPHFDADRKLIAQEMDAGFFAKVGKTGADGGLDADTLQKLKELIQSHPELLSELLKGTN